MKKNSFSYKRTIWELADIDSGKSNSNTHK